MFLNDQWKVRIAAILLPSTEHMQIYFSFNFNRFDTCFSFLSTKPVSIRLPDIQSDKTDRERHKT